MRIITFVSLFIFFAAVPSVARAADNWWFEDSVGTSGVLYSEDFSSGNGYISGASGFVAKTSDYGKSWTDISTGSSTFYGVAYYGGDAYAVGGSGLLKKYSSTSGWSTLSTGTTTTLYDIAGYSTSLYAVGSSGTILRSTDSGASFSQINTRTTSSTLNAVANSSAEFFAVGANGTVLRKSASATTFTAVSSGTTATLYGVDVYYKTGSPTVWISGFGGLLKKSTDGGTSWSTITIPGVGAAESIYDIDFNGDDGIATASGRIYFTDDGGASWDEVDYGDADTGSILYDIGLNNTGSSLFMRAAGYSGFFLFEDSTPTAPSALTVSSPTTDTTPSFSWTAGSDTLSNITYEMTLDGVSNDASLSLTGSATSATWAPALSDDTYAVSLYAVDESGNASSAATASLVVDTAGPTVTMMFGSEDGTVGEDYSLYVMAGDASGVTSCLALVEGESESYEMTFSPALLMWYGTYTPTVAGELEFLVECEDGLGHTGQGRTDVTFTAADTGDTTAPSVSIVSPTEWVERYTSTAVIATVTDAMSVSRCDLYNNGSLWAEMTVAGESATVFTSFEDSSAPIYVRCADTSGNVGVSSTVTLEVLSEEEALARESTDTVDDSTDDSTTSDDTSTDDTGTGTSDSSGADETALIDDEQADQGGLIKMACDETQAVDVNDPCKAVYFYGGDGKRHAFPNEKVFFTWYDDFDSVVIVSDDYMGDITLGANVTYRPGSRMVKFQSVRTVYMVSRGGVLRAVVSEEVARDFYGDTWNQFIDDISDAFFGNYSFGEDVDAEGDYDIDEERNLAESIDDSL
ncbi:hypothetical protein HY631_01760 [Candidatus Uhrbacteria bacterium]|nr:hypothetical protein [Candidatus Uhrbacteria bacterium]